MPRRDYSDLIEALETAFGLEEESDKSAQRHAYIQSVLAKGGKPFVDRVRSYGATDKGEPLRMPQWFCELLECIGDYRVPHTLTTGCAQLGKTQSHTLLIADTIVHGKLNAGWFYASRDSRNLNVPEQFYPVLDKWLERLAIETGEALGDEGDRQNTARYQVDGVTAIFSYANTSKPTPSRQGLATAGGAAVSFTANVLFLEERSQWIPGTADPLPRRLDASLIPTRPIRELGTPGAGQGIEVEIERAHYWFYPHYRCDLCGEAAPLDPKGCLLRQFKRKDLSGKEVEGYLSESGRPVQWWHREERDPIDTAYFACSHCGHPLRDEQRDAAWFQCRRTGVTMRSFLDHLPTSQGRLKVALHLSPLCRMTQNNLAAELVRGGVEAVRAEDWQQQALGHPSENTTNSVSLDMLKRAIVAPKPVGKPAVRLAGIDQGRGEDWLWQVACYLPEGWESMPISQVLEQTVRVVEFAGDVIRTVIPERLNDLGTEYGLIDNEPDRSDAADLCAVTCLEMADQKPGLNDAVKEGKVMDGGQEYACWQLRNEKFLKQVLLNFAMVAADGEPLYRLPDDWGKWIGVNTERSPLRHLTGPAYDPDTGRWRRGEGNVDDLYFAAMFAEAALYLWLLNGPRDFEFESLGARSSYSSSGYSSMF